MKVALWILGGLLAADALFMSYVHILRRDYYFPGRYEDAFAATLWGLLFGASVLALFLFVLYLKRRRGPKQ